jgi:hypothetical protein
MKGELQNEIQSVPTRPQYSRSKVPITMKLLGCITVLGTAIARPLVAQDPASIEKAATKYVARVSWRRESIVSGNFTCQGRKEQAILGVTESEIVIAVFVKGLDKRPEVLRYSGKARNPKTAELKIEDLDYDPKEMIGSDLEGFQRSKSCKGLNLWDGRGDSAHIYWDHKSHRFEDWTL